MSQTDLAVASRRQNSTLRVTASDISRYESEKTTPGANVLAAIAKSLRRDIEFFYESGGEDDIDEEAALQAARLVPEALVDRIVAKRVQQRLEELGVSETTGGGAEWQATGRMR